MQRLDADLLDVVDGHAGIVGPLHLVKVLPVEGGGVDGEIARGEGGVLRNLRVGALNDGAEDILVRVVHHTQSVDVPLVGAHVVTLPPPPAHHLLEVGARIDLLVPGREVVQELGGGVDARRRQAEGGRVHLAWVVGAMG